MKIIICGSMTASKEMVKAEVELKAMGHEVVLPEFTYDYAQMDTSDQIHSESSYNKIKHDLIKRHYHKIQDGDALLIINVERKEIDGYIGGNTLLEMGFAHILDKPIYLMYRIPDMGYRDEIEVMKPIVINGNLSLIKGRVNV